MFIDDAKSDHYVSRMPRSLPLWCVLWLSACPSSSSTPPPKPSAPAVPKLTAELKAHFDSIAGAPCRKSAIGPEWQECGVAVFDYVELASAQDTTLRRVAVGGRVPSIPHAAARIEQVAGKLMSATQLNAIREALRTPELLSTGKMLTVRSEGGVYLLTLQEVVPDGGAPQLFFRCELVFDEK